MRFLLAEDFWALDMLNPFEWHLLAKLPETAAGVGLPPGVRERLFPPLLPGDTLADGETVAMAEDWGEFVRPEIAGRLESERDVVERDLGGVDWVEFDEPGAGEGGDEDGREDDQEDDQEDGDFEGFEPAAAEERRPPGERFGRVTVSSDHTDAWYSTLNQARILMHEAHRLADADERRLAADRVGGGEGEGIDGEIDRERLYLVAQYEFYSALQSLLVEHAMRP